MFLWKRKLKKNQGIKENCITTFDTLNWGLFEKIKLKQIILKIFLDIQIEIEYFCRLPDLKKA